jgi:2-aminoadipate transaminase
LDRVSVARRAASLSPTLSGSDHGDAISFDSGHAFPAVLPDLTTASERALNQYRHEALQYGPRPGLREMREWIAGHLAGEGAAVGADDLLIVNGAKQAIELVCRTLLDPGDSIVVTGPTYFTSIPLFRSFEVEFIEIGQDAEGLDTGELEAVLDRRRREGRPTPKFIYDVPEFHNPTGVTMSRRRREALLDIAGRHGTWVVEDSPYRAIRFEGSPQPSLLALDGGSGVIHVGTFSKLIAPGTRIGWVTAPREILARMVQLKADGGSSPLVQRIVVEWLKDGNLPGHTENARRTYRAHRDRMLEALKREMPDTGVAVPQGGYYLWLTLPGDVDADELAARAAQAGVIVIPGSKFYASAGPGFPRNEGPPKNRMRLAYSHADEEQIDLGIRRVAEALRSMRH